MKTLLIIAASCALAHLSAALDLKTTDGAEYKDCTLSRTEPDGLVVTTASGIEKIPFTKLSPELQTQYGYNPKIAADFAAKSIESARATDKKRAEAAAAARQEQAHKAAIAASTMKQHFCVTEILKDGVLADKMRQEHTRGAVQSSLGRIGGGGNVAGSAYVTTYSKTGEIVFVSGIPSPKLGKAIACIAYRDSNYTHEPAPGFSQIFEKWVYIAPEKTP